jgi:cytochrome c oxidase assembly protein subunit 11
MEPAAAQRNRRFLKRAMLVCACTFLLGFAMVPIYRIACVHIFKTKIDNNADNAALAASTREDSSRWITVQFIGNVNSALKWQFAPELASVKVHPGAISEAWFDATNLAPTGIVGNAVPSVAPNFASSYFIKTECFCFTEQALKAGESRRMPVRFFVDPKVPANIDTLTLSYTFYNNELATKKLAEQELAATKPAS